jgi:hypothetical protein
VAERGTLLRRGCGVEAEAQLRRNTGCVVRRWIVTTGPTIAAAPYGIRGRAARPRTLETALRWPPLPVAPDPADGSGRFPICTVPPDTAHDVPVEPRMRLRNASPGCPNVATTLVESGIKATIFNTGLSLRDNPVRPPFLPVHHDLFAIEDHGALHIPPVLGHRRIYGTLTAGDLAAVRCEATDGTAFIRAATGTASQQQIVAVPGIVDCRTERSQGGKDRQQRTETLLMLRCRHIHAQCTN